MENTTEKLVTRATVEKAYNKTKKQSVKDLLDEMKNLDQGKIKKKALEKATNQPHCSKCHDPLAHSEISGISQKQDGDKCNSCEEEEAQKRNEAKVIKDFKDLCDELNALCDKPLYKFEKGEYSHTHIITRKEGKHYVEIHRASVWGGSYRYMRATGNALRIKTDEYDVKANRLKKDFGAKNLAEGLHKKSDELLAKLVSRDEARKERKEKTETVDAIIDKLFQGLEVTYGITAEWRRTQSGGYHTGTREIEIQDKDKTYRTIMTLSTDDGIMYRLKGIRVDFTTEEIKEQIKTINALYYTKSEEHRG